MLGACFHLAYDISCSFCLGNAGAGDPSEPTGQIPLKVSQESRQNTPGFFYASSCIQKSIAWAFFLPSFRSQTLKKALTNPDSIAVFITCVGIIGNDIVQTDALYYGSR